MKKPFTVYFVPKTHHDLGYTHTIDDLLLAYCQYYDDVLDFCEQTEEYPPEAQYRYTVESFWSLDYYLKHTTDTNRERMKRYVQSKRIEIQALYANVIDGICSEEEIHRLIYPSAAYAKECGVSLTSAALTDIPGMSAGLIKALAAADIPYLFVGFPTYFEWGDAAQNPLPQTRSFWDEKKLFGRSHPFAFDWKSLDGGKVFCWYQFGYGYMGKDISPLFEAEDEAMLSECLPQYVEALRASTPYTVMRYVDHGLDNVPPSMALCDVVRRWNETHEDIQCVVATESMFFEALRRDCEAQEIPEIRGELPHTDYTMLAFTEAEMTALNARTKERMQMLERFGTLTRKNLNEPMSALYNDAILYDEHCFGMGRAGARNEYNRTLKNGYALRAAWKADDLWKESFPIPDLSGKNKLSLFFGAGISSDGAIASWMQYDTADTKTTLSRLDSGSGAPLYLQCDVIDEPTLPLIDLAERYARRNPNAILKQYTLSIPPQSANLAVKPIGEAVETSLTTDAICNDSFFENRYYRIEFNQERGGACRIFDKELQKELIDTDHPFGGLLVKEIESDTLYTPTLHRMRHRLSGAVADSMVLYGSVYSVPSFVTEITLYHTTKRIDVSHRILLDRTPLREVFTVFPFAMNTPRFSYQGIGTPIRAFDDIVEGSNTNQYACGHWCRVDGEEGSCVLAMSEARITEFGGIHPTAVSQAHRQLSPAGFDLPYIRKEDIQNGHIVSMLAYNNCQTNFAPTQQGEVIYRYAITSGKDIHAEAFAESFTCPPVLFAGENKEASISLDAENVGIVSCKYAEDGDGMILRIKEFMRKDTAFSIRDSNGTPLSVTPCNALEESLPEGQDLVIKSYETLTLKIGLNE